jgi:glycosyltransferase involved in cell wall biosynthesis
MLAPSSHQKISVIIPTCNRVNLIRNAIASVINQKDVETEIIVVDDGSEDDTQNVIKSLQTKYSNLFYYQNERSKGPSGARNTGILKSSGDFLSFLDSDDIWMDNHLASGLKILNLHPEIDVFFGNFGVVEYFTGKHLYNFFDQKKILHAIKSKKINSNIYVVEGNMFEALIQENFFHLGSLILRASSRNNILLDESVRYAEDLDFAIRLFKEAKATFVYCKDPVFIQFRHDSNLYAGGGLKTSIQVLKALIYLFSKYLRIYHLTNKERRILHRLCSISFAHLSLLHCKNQDYRGTLSCILQSVKHGVSLRQFKLLMKVVITLLRTLIS